MSPRLAVLAWMWLGAALLFVTVVAPATFAVLPTRALAGLVVGRILPVLFWSGVVVGAVHLRGRDRWRRAAALALVLSSLGAQIGVAPNIQRQRAAMGSDLESIDPSDPRRTAFGRLHAVSVALLGVGMLGAAVLAIGALRSSARRDADATPRVERAGPTHLPAGV